MQTQVIILGAGCGGLWLAYELLKAGIATLLIDSLPFGSYASTRNQSWLHSGALYAVSNQLPLVDPCKQGYKEIDDFCSRFAAGAIENDSKCIFLFDSEQARKVALDRLEAAQIDIKQQEQKEIVQMEPVLAPSKFTGFGIQTLDAPFDSGKILQALATEVFKFGPLLRVESGDLRHVKITRSAGLWKVEVGKMQHSAAIIVSAAGVLNASILAESFGDKYGLTMQKSVVGVIHQRFCENILLARRSDSSYLNVVPFAGGVSVNFGAFDVAVEDPNDHEPWANALMDFGRQLTDFFPGLLKMPACQAHFYVCQKVNNTNAPNCSHPLEKFGNRHYFWINPADNFFAYYPGKFTLSPIGARELCSKITAIMGQKASPHHRVRRVGSSVQPQIAIRPYFATATHVTSVERNALLFRPIK